MTTPMQQLREDMRKRNPNAQAEALRYLTEQVHMSAADASRIINMTAFTEDISPEESSVEALDRFRNRYGNNIEIQRLPQSDVEEEYLRNVLIGRGVDEADADRIINRTQITGNRRANLQRVAQSANALHIDIGQERPEQGKYFVKPGSKVAQENAVIAEQESLKRILTEYGATPEDAERILNTASITGVNRRVNLGHIRRAAEQEGVSLDWPGFSQAATEGEAETENAAVSLATKAEEQAANFANNLGNWLASQPTPGGVTGLVIVLIVLWFAVIRVWGTKTRLELIWDTITGQAKVQIDPNDEFDKNVPVPGFEAMIEKVADDIADSGVAGKIGKQVADGIKGNIIPGVDLGTLPFAPGVNVGQAVQGARMIGGLAGSALNDVESFLTKEGQAVHKGLTGGGGIGNGSLGFYAAGPNTRMGDL